jgi:hypothetical protein
LRARLCARERRAGRLAKGNIIGGSNRVLAAEAARFFIARRKGMTRESKRLAMSI